MFSLLSYRLRTTRQYQILWDRYLGRRWWEEEQWFFTPLTSSSYFKCSRTPRNHKGTITYLHLSIWPWFLLNGKGRRTKFIPSWFHNNIDFTKFLLKFLHCSERKTLNLLFGVLLELSKQKVFKNIRCLNEYIRKDMVIFERFLLSDADRE